MAKNETVNNELATTDYSEEIVPVSFEDISANKSGVINTINTATMEGKVAAFNALSNAVSLNDLKDTELAVKDCIIMPGIRKGRGNTPDTECLNTYLIDTEGRAFFTQSDGIARSAKMLAMMFPDMGKTSPNGCLTIHVESNQLQNGNTIKTLALDI